MSQHLGRAAWILVGALWLVIACSQSEKQAEPAAPSPAAAAPAAPAPAATAANSQAEAEKIFTERCVTCHGVSGMGDGPASGGLVPKPANFRDPAWQQSVSDQHIEQIVQYGGAAVGKAPTMPANPDLMSKPDVVAALRAYIRALSK